MRGHTLLGKRKPESGFGNASCRSRGVHDERMMFAAYQYSTVPIDNDGVGDNRRVDNHRRDVRWGRTGLTKYKGTWGCMEDMCT